MLAYLASGVYQGQGSFKGKPSSAQSTEKPTSDREIIPTWDYLKKKKKKGKIKTERSKEELTLSYMAVKVLCKLLCLTLS